MSQSLNVKKIMIIAGEASGDLHGSHLVSAMLNKTDNLSFFGIGGPAMKEAGVNILVDAAELTVMGITGVISKLPAIFRGLSVAKTNLKAMRPELLILIDFADFNLRMAAFAKKNGVPVLYYIPPKVWAWRTGRINKIKNCVDQVAVILPFEEPFFKRHSVPATYVGNPLLDYYPAPIQTDAKNEGDAPVVGFLPGSRPSEINRHLPVMADAAQLIKIKFPATRFLVSVAPSFEKQDIKEKLDTYQIARDMELVTGPVSNLFKKSTLVVAASGTVTLEAALAGIPMIIIYKMSAFNFWVARTFIRAKFAGLASLIANEEVAPELFQNAATPENISSKVCGLLGDPERLSTMKKKLLDVRNLMGKPGVSERAADIALGMLNDVRA